VSATNWLDCLQRLVEQVPPPALPVRADGDWDEFARQNSFMPPTDYRALIRRYGAGCFGDWLRPIEPFDPSLPFIAAAGLECRQLRGFQREFPHFYPPWPIWPDAGGLLPWATTATGDHIGWRTDGNPDDWTILVWTRDGDDSREHRVGAVQFLLGLVERTLGDPAFRYEDADPTADDSRPRFSAAPSQAPTPPFVGSVLVRYAPLPARHPAFDSAVQAAFGLTEESPSSGLVLRSYGVVGADPGQLHHELSIEFELEAERQAKELALGIGEIIAVPIIEVLDLERSPVWPDVVGRPSTAPHSRQ
jgi:hypothetical protein